MRKIPVFSRLRQAFGEWLGRYNWTWWSTWTFRDEVSPLSAKKVFARFIVRTCPGSWYFLAVEWHRWRDSVHCHALVGGVEGVRRLSVMDEWYRRYGIARIVEYNPKLGARYYLTKYITKELADWDVNLPCKQRGKKGVYKS